MNKMVLATLIAVMEISATALAEIPKPKRGEKCQREVSITTRHPEEAEGAVYLCGPEAKIRPTVGRNAAVVIRFYANVPFTVKPYATDETVYTAKETIHAGYGDVYSAVVHIVPTDGRGVVTEITVTFDRPNPQPVRMSWPYQWQLPSTKRRN